MQYATGVDMVEYSVRGALGMDCSELKMKETTGVFSNYMILSTVSGKFKGIEFDKEFKENNLLDVYCTHKDGDTVIAYKNTTHSLGTIIFKADSVREMINLTNNIEKYYKVVVS